MHQMQVDAPDTFYLCPFRSISHTPEAFGYSRVLVTLPVGLLDVSLRCCPQSEFQDEPYLNKNYDGGALPQ